MTQSWSRLEGVSLDGEYHLQQWLSGDASGGFFLATFGPEMRRALLKVVAEDPATSAQQLARWQRTAALFHPNLLPLLDSRRTETASGRVLYAVFEYPDDSVATALQSGPLSEAEAHELAVAAIDGLRYIHSQGMVHTSIDAKHVVAVSERIQLFCDAMREADASAGGPAEDIRALGALIYELLTTRSPGATVEVDGIGDPFRTIIRGCLEPDVHRRWTLEDIARALNPETALSAAAATAAAPVPPAIPAPQAPNPEEIPGAARRTPAKPLLLVSAGAVVLAAVLFVAVHRGPAESSAKEAILTPPQPAIAQPAPQVVEPAPKVVVPKQPEEPSPRTAWRVITYTYSTYQDAARKAHTINKKWPDLKAEVFTSKGQSEGPYMVAIGGRMTREEALALQQKVQTQGLPPDTYIQNYSN